MRRRRQGGGQENDIIALYFHAPAGILIDQLTEVLAEEVQQAFDGQVLRFVLVRVHADIPILGDRMRSFDLEFKRHTFVDVSFLFDIVSLYRYSIYALTRAIVLY